MLIQLLDAKTSKKIVRYQALFWGGVGLLISFVAVSPAFAGWFPWKRGEKSMSAQYAPPPKDMIQETCHPHRARVQAVNKKNRVVRPFYWPWKSYQQHQYYQCMEAFMEQEKAYIEHRIDVSPVDPSSDNPLSQENNRL